VVGGVRITTYDVGSCCWMLWRCDAKKINRKIFLNPALHAIFTNTKNGGGMIF
jgi:hypothetical protein